MICPFCKLSLEKSLLSNVEVDFCPRCYGMWFEEDELQAAKDEKDRNLRWLDIDLWKDEGLFKVSPGVKPCPFDRLPLYAVEYGDSGIQVDVCSICRGVWLDRGEFKSILTYLKEKADYEVLYHYLKNLKEELWEVFSGPELLREEIIDFLTILKLLRYKFAVQHPAISQAILAMPK